MEKGESWRAPKLKLPPPAPAESAPLARWTPEVARLPNKEEAGGTLLLPRDLPAAMRLIGEFSGLGLFRTVSSGTRTGAVHFQRHSEWIRTITFSPLLKNPLIERVDAEVFGNLSCHDGWVQFDFSGKGELRILPGDLTVQKVFRRELRTPVRWDFTLIPQGVDFHIILRELEARR